MLFKNATIVQLTEDLQLTPELLQEKLEPYRYMPARSVESERRGWISPVDESAEELVRAYGSVYLLSLKTEQKILPSSVIKEELRERVEAQGMGGRKLPAKERQRMIEEIRFDLLPKAFSKLSRIHGYIDTERKVIVIGSASANQVDDFLGSLRLVFRPLPAMLLSPKRQPQNLMTHWLRNDDLPPKTMFGSEIALEDPTEGGKGTFRKQDLSSTEIAECIHAGKIVQRVAIEWNDYLSFTLDDRLVLRKIAPMDMFDEEPDVDDDQHAKFDADFLMTVMAMRTLLPEIYDWFDVDPQAGTVVGDGTGDFSLSQEDMDMPLRSTPLDAQAEDDEVPGAEKEFDGMADEI